MSFWIAAAAAVVLASAWIVRPLLLRNRIELDESEHALSVFHDQMDELDRDAELDLISPSQRDEARREIERRAARAAGNHNQGLALARRSPVLAALAGAGIALTSLGLYAVLGSPGEPDRPLAARKAAVERQLAKAHDAVPAFDAAAGDAGAGSFEQWWTRAREFAAEGDHVSAADAYRRAAELSGDAPAVVSAYAESLTLANGNRVPAAARIIFQQLLERSPGDPRARYYLALARAQAKDFEGALDDWRALLADSSPDASWVPIVRRDIVNMARFLERDLAGVLPDATEDERAHASTPVASATAEATPQRLDWRAVIAQARASAADGDLAAARERLAAARAAYAGAPFVLAQLEDAQRQLQTEARRRGPSDADVAAASQLSQADRDQMVRGMVDGLARRLENDPSDFDGWMMLIRSYAVLQERELAERAARQALAAFTSGPQRSALQRSVAELGLAVN